MNDLTAMCKECCNFLIRSTFIKGEPITGRLMVDTKQYTSKRAKILCDRNNMIIGKLRIDRHRKQYILSMFTDISHVSKRLII